MLCLDNKTSDLWAEWNWTVEETKLDGVNKYQIIIFNIHQKMHCEFGKNICFIHAHVYLGKYFLLQMYNK